MKIININEKIDYSSLNKYKLSDVKEFFYQRAYEELIMLNINSIGELLEKEENGELIQIFFKKHKDSHDMWNTIHGTIQILKCKYFNIDPNIDFSDEYDFIKKIGIRQRLQKRFKNTPSLKLSNLLNNVENNQYDILYENFSYEVANEIVNKLKVLNDYIKNNQKYNSVEIDDLKKLNYKLAELLKEYEKITNQIEEVRKEIRKKKQVGVKK